MARRSLAVAFAAILALSQVGAAFAGALSPQQARAQAIAAKIDKGLAKQLTGSATTRFIVEFVAKADLKPAGREKTHAGKAKAVFKALTQTANASQASALQLLKNVKGANARSYWLTNSLVVTGDNALAQKLAALPTVSTIHAQKIYPLVKPVNAKAAILAAAGDPEWGVAKIRADQAWDEGVLGQGITVASVDTGVDYTHPALVDHFRGNNHDGTFTFDYNWWDPADVCGGTPCDNVGHGTHTMGTMVGGDGPGPFTPDTGVAPGAIWFAAKGCEDFGCSSESLLSAGQFIVAPTKLDGTDPQPALAPHVVNNSWGSDDPNDQFYMETVEAWRAAGIIPVFSAGNAGPGCGTAGTPGDFTNVISLGATTSTDVIADFSSRGPSPTGKTSPNLSAPGQDVISSVPGGGYESFSGTSMAAPHASGTIALMLSAKASLIGNYDAVLNALNATAIDKPDGTCGTSDPSDNDPNYVYGEGRIDAKAAVDLVATGGTLSGTVTDSATHLPIPGARVSANDGSREFAATTDTSGNYEIFLAANTYLVTAQAFGYAAEPHPGVVIRANETTDNDFALDALPRFLVSGHVRASEDGSAIAGASVTALGTPLDDAVTDATGAYSISLPVGDYTLQAAAGGCTEVGTSDVSVVDHPVTVDFSLFRKLDDYGHGCRPIDFHWETAGTQSALFGDEFAGRLTLPFAFNFYGTNYNQVFISDNGYINFLAPDQYNGFPVAIPSTNTPNAAVYVFWQDLFLDDQSSINYTTIGSAPNRAFVLEYKDVKAYGASGRLNFEIKLYEGADGAIELLYGNNAANPGDGRNAGIGIENATGSDALQFSFLEGLAGKNKAYRIERVPSGMVHGVVTDANDGLPIAGAHVSASPGHRSATTANDGTYSLRLRPGNYTLTGSQTLYSDGSTPQSVADGGDYTINFALKASKAAVAPASINETIAFGGSVTRNVALSNSGSATLSWTAKERPTGVELPVLPEATGIVIRKPNWKRVTIPATFPRVKIADSGLTLETIITDPPNDSLDSNELTTVRAASDGTSVATLALDFSSSTPMDSIGGYIYLDTDQNAATGLPAEALFGQPTQDIGMEYFADLFEANGSDPFVPIFSADTFDLVAIVPATITGHTIQFDIPLDAVGGDDGFINVGMVVGQLGPSDWAPDTGHGTIQPFSDVPWVSETPDAGSVAIGGTQTVGVKLDAAGLTPGAYHALAVFITNAPKQQQVPVEITLNVTLPAQFGRIAGTVTDAHSGAPIGDVTVSMHAQWLGSPLELSATTGADGSYSITGPEGTWPTDYTLGGYVPYSRNVTITRAVTTNNVNAQLHLIQPHAEADGGPFTFVLTPNRHGHGTVSLSNPGGHADLTFTTGEVDLNGAGGSVAAASTARKLPTGKNPLAKTTRGLFGATSLAVPPAIRGDGDVLASFNAGMSLPWGVGYDSTIWLSDPVDLIDVDFDNAGTRLGQFATPWAGQWPADMAFDSGRHLIWQVNVGGDNGIYGVNPADGSVVTHITGTPWSNTSQRGLAYDPTNDVFYIGGWNEGIVYRVAGPSWPTPGATLNQCNPPDPNISGLAFNTSFQLLWEATNSDTDTIYLLDPITCDAQRSLPHPDGGGFGGAGIETDVVGNLWTVGQNTGNAYLIESGLPNFSDVPWLSVSPTSGTITPDHGQNIDVSVDTTGMSPGLYRALVVIQTNDRDHSNIQVPVLLVVPAYQQGVNAGGGAYTNANGDVFAADRVYAAGAYGYAGASSTKSTGSAIAGTIEDPLYQNLRTGMTAYRFDLPNGRYRIDLSFAEIALSKRGARVFSVSIEGTTVLSNLDVYALAGKNAALDRSFEVEVTDGRLDIAFAAQRGDKPIVNAILVTELPEGAPGP